MITKQDTIYEWIQNGQLEDALKALFQNIEEEPNTIENYINAGIVLVDINEIEKVEVSFNEQLRLMIKWCSVLQLSQSLLRSR